MVTYNHGYDMHAHTHAHTRKLETNNYHRLIKDSKWMRASVTISIPGDADTVVCDWNPKPADKTLPVAPPPNDDPKPAVVFTVSNFSELWPPKRAVDKDMSCILCFKFLYTIFTFCKLNSTFGKGELKMFKINNILVQLFSVRANMKLRTANIISNNQPYLSETSLNWSETYPTE